MLRWSLKSLVSEPLNFLLTSLVVGAALLLVIFFEAVFSGESEKIISYPRNINPDVWVMQRGVFNMHMATSFIWDWKKDRVAEIDGVAEVTPILYLNSIVEAGGKRWFSFVVGLEEGDSRAGPWQMAQGTSQPGRGEAVVPDLLATMAGLDIGNTVRIANKSFTIAGLSKGTFSMANSITFISYSDLKDIMSLTGSDSYLLVDAEQGIDAGLLAERIKENVDKVNALTSREFIHNDKVLAMQMGVELIGIMTIIGACLAVFLCVFMLYVFLAKRRRDLAILKAVGVDNKTIYLGIILQATFIAAAGLLVAIVFIYAAIPLTAAYFPQVTLEVTAYSLFRVVIVTFLVAIFAALLPAYQVVKIDPLLAFQR